MLDRVSHRNPAAPWNQPAWSCRALHVIGGGAFVGDVAGKTVADIATFTRQEWMRIPNCGRRTTNEIAEVLGEYGLAFRGEQPTPLWQPPAPDVRDFPDEQLVMELLRRGYSIAYARISKGPT
jgi:hypothetical protein